MKMTQKLKKSTTQTKSTTYRAKNLHHHCKSRYGLSAHTSIHAGGLFWDGGFLWYDVGYTERT